MKRFSFLPALIMITLFITSCSSPLNRKYSDDKFMMDVKAIKESKKLSDEDMKLLAGYIIRAKMTGEKLETMTYAEMLKKAQDAVAEQKALADKTAKEEAEKRTRLGAAVNVALYNIGYVKGDFQDHIQYDLAFENKSGKDIKAVKGSLLITDLFDKKIKELDIVFDNGVKASETFKNSYSTDYNQFMDEDKELRAKSIKEVKFVFTPEKVLFNDGTSLE